MTGGVKKAKLCLPPKAKKPSDTAHKQTVAKGPTGQTAAKGPTGGRAA